MVAVRAKIFGGVAHRAIFASEIPRTCTFSVALAGAVVAAVTRTGALCTVFAMPTIFAETGVVYTSSMRGTCLVAQMSSASLPTPAILTEALAIHATAVLAACRLAQTLVAGRPAPAREAHTLAIIARTVVFITFRTTRARTTRVTLPPIITLALEVFAHAVIVAVLWAHHGRAGRILPAGIAIASAVLLADTMATTDRRTNQALPGFQRLLFGNCSPIFIL